MQKELAYRENDGVAVALLWQSSTNSLTVSVLDLRNEDGFDLEVDPEAWFLEDEGYQLAVFHSHLSSPPRPSRTDVENIGLWEGRPYVILSLHSGELAGWRIDGGRVEPEELSVDP